MSQQRIGQGPGNQVADSEVKKFKCNGTIAKGDVLTLVGTSGLTVDQCSTILPAVGVAAEGGTDGQWIDVVVSGFCNFVTNDGTDVVAGDLLYSGAGVAVPAALGTDISTTSGGCFGMSVDAETSTTCTNVIVFKRI
jgi:hypothetical protein